MVTHLIVATKYKNVVKKKLYVESFIEYPKNVSNKILGDYYSKIDYSAYDEAKLLKLIKIKSGRAWCPFVFKYKCLVD